MLESAKSLATTPASAQFAQKTVTDMANAIDRLTATIGRSAACC
jgi:hypothetical protein